MSVLVKSGLTMFATALVLTMSVAADVPSMFSYQGFLTDSEGTPVNGVVELAFSICADSLGSACNWTEYHAPVTVTDGQFNVKLGSITPITDDLLAGTSRWLGINVDGESLPYTQLVSVPFAHRISTVDGATGGTIDGELTIGGGSKAPGDLIVTGKATIGPGHTNSGASSFVAGSGNSAYNDYTAISGGQYNSSENNYTVIAGGLNNETFGEYSVVSGGHNQVASGDYSVISGGFQNDAGADYATIGGGRVNKVYGYNGTIAGGWVNQVDGQRAAILGGAQNLVAGDYSAILGGFGDTISASADYSYLFGIQSTLNGDSTFMVDMPHIRFGDEASGYEFPTADGSAGQVMATDGSGQLSWTTGGGGGGGGGWVDDGAVVRLDADADEVGVGTVTPDAKLHVEAAQTHAGRFTSSVGTNDSAVFTAEYIGGGDVDAIAIHGKSFPNDYWGIGGKFESNYLGVHAEVYPAGSNTYLGMNSRIDGGTGNNFGLVSRAQNCDQATGVDAIGQNGTTFATGILGRVNVNSSNSYGVMGSISSGATGDFSYGIHGLAQGSGIWNYGSHGQASGASTGNIGVSAGALGNSGWKRAINANTYGTGTNYAIYCWSEDATATENYGIYASASGASSINWAGYFNGNVNITGTLTGGKSGMRIDHPDDPENRYLQHSNIVSPDMMTVYNGNVVTDSEGRATVELPDYFESLNGDFRYQLTAIGSFSQTIILDEITNNQFVIATDQPSVKVSWQVTGIRKDPLATTQRIETELVKAANEKGLYQNPTAFGLTSDRGINQVEAPAKNEQIDEFTAHQTDAESAKQK